MPELVDKVALVTGATSGIGEAITIALAKASVHVAATGRNAEKLKTFEGELRRRGAQASTFAADLSTSPGKDALATLAMEELGGIDILVHAAGMAAPGDGDVDEAAFEQMLQINVLAAHGLVQRLMPSLVERQGQIVFINSRAGYLVQAKLAGYCASKFALRAYADGVRESLRPEGVRVISIFPGKVDTPMLRTLMSELGAPYEPEKYAKPDDIARAVVDALMVPRHIEIPEITVRPFSD
jgi:NADP-dependent 3-hydroxy acid dehydrogenase YdfG